MSIWSIITAIGVIVGIITDVITILSFFKNNGSSKPTNVDNSVHKTFIVNQQTTINYGSNEASSSNDLTGVIAIVILLVAGSLYAKFRIVITMFCMGLGICSSIGFLMIAKRTPIERNYDIIFTYIGDMVTFLSVIFFLKTPSGNYQIGPIDAEAIHKIIGAAFGVLAFAYPLISVWRKKYIKKNTGIQTFVIALVSLLFTSEVFLMALSHFTAGSNFSGM